MCCRAPRSSRRSTYAGTAPRSRMRERWRARRCRAPEGEEPMASSVAMKKGDELAGKVALVTGAARNIGRAIARSLAAGGAAVMVNAKTSRDEAQETVELIEKAGGRAAVHIADITEPRAVAGLMDAAAKRFG